MEQQQDPRLVAALQEIANLAAQHAVESFQLRQRIAELESRVAETAAEIQKDVTA